ncbi:COGs COG3777 [hydrothermal vent metagenome]|uniref:COGs COG3777 n=1 Tax=hydrothermal vent metagenome TaxID=652676 RepID=A0A3B0SFM7_9ZZZZ
MREAMQTQPDKIDPARARALQATLGYEATLTQGQPLPPFFHQLYFWDPQPPGALGRDGHPKTGGLIPDMGLPRRMWAGGRLKFHAPLIAGLAAERRSVLENTSHKTGRSGPLALITLRHEIWQGGQRCITEWQDLIYRGNPDPKAARPVPSKARTDEDTRQQHSFNPTFLFRYSALTFNGHRIHYDRDYARKVEGYDGLVVHGPLLAQLLILMAEKQLGQLSTFSLRATSALMDFEGVDLCWKAGDAWARGPDGRQIMSAKAS